MFNGQGCHEEDIHRFNYDMTMNEFTGPFLWQTLLYQIQFYFKILLPEMSPC